MDYIFLVPINLLLIFNLLKIYNLPFADDNIRLVCYALIGVFCAVLVLYRLWKAKIINMQGLAASFFFYSAIMTANLWLRNGTESADWLNCWMVPASAIGGLCIYKYKCDFEKIVDIESAICQIVIILYIYNKLFTHQAGSLKLNSVFYVLLLLPFAMCQRRLLFRTILLLEISFCVFISLKRTALIILVIILAYYLFIQERKERNRLFKGFLIIVAVALLFFVVQNRLGYNLTGRVRALSEDDGSGRGELYGSLFLNIFNRDFIDIVFGGGLRAVYNLLNATAHNDFFEILYDFGIIGFACYLKIYSSIIKTYKDMKYNKFEYSMPFLCSIIIFFVMSLLSHLMMIPTYMMYLTLFWATSIRYYQSIKNSICKGELENEDSNNYIS